MDNNKSQNKKAVKAKVKSNKKRISFGGVVLAVFMIALPLIIGSIASVFTISAQESFGAFKQPPLAPPAWLFPVVWTILYIMMGIASYLIYRVIVKKPAEKKLKIAELVVFYIQLAFNFVWTLLFFNADAKYFAFGWLMAMWLMILALIIMTFRNQKIAAWLLLPYLLWCTFAAYLNISIAILN